MRSKLYSSTNLSNVIAHDEGMIEQGLENQVDFRSGFPAGFKRVRKESGLSQDKFCKIFGVSLATVRGWEQGRHLPEIDTIERLCDFFHCCIDYLLHRTDYREYDAQLVHEYTGLSDDAVETLQLLKQDTQTMAVINHLLSYRSALKRLVLLFASEFWKNGYIDPYAEGRIISAYMRRHEEKLCLINSAEDITQEVKDFHNDHKDNQTFSEQMVFRLLKGSAEESGIDLPIFVYKKLKEYSCHKLHYSNEQIRTAVKFLLFCGYEETMKHDGFDFQKYVDLNKSDFDEAEDEFDYEGGTLPF